jgi:integrase
MARQAKIRWDKATKRWYVNVNGRNKYLGYGRGKTDSESYKLAQDKWDEIRLDEEAKARAAKPHADQYQQAIALREAMVDWCVSNRAEPDTHDRLVKELEWLRQNFAKPTPPSLKDCCITWANGSVVGATIDPIAYLDQTTKLIWRDRLDVLRSCRRSTEPDKAIGQQIDNYLTMRLAQARSGKIAHKRYRTCEDNLNRYRQFAGALSVDQLDAKALTAYEQHLLGMIEAGRSPFYVRTILADFKAFVKWLDQEEIIERLPRNFARLKIEAEVSEPRTIPTAEVKAILKKAEGKTKLYVLLMLNCGYSQKDLADLRPEEVNWKTGVITRKRSKTKKQASVPVVRYRLWSETFDLLKSCGNRTGDRVLLNEAGQPLRTMAFQDKGTGLKSGDAVRKAIQKITDRQPKLFRKTSSTLLYNHKDFRGLADLFLGHSPKTVGERNYYKPGDDILGDALAYLAEQYGLTTELVTA